MSRMVFNVSTLGYIQHTQSIILDYEIVIKNLKEQDRIFEAGALGNFSLAGFEMVRLTSLFWNWLSKQALSNLWGWPNKEWKKKLLAEIRK